jgi:hypothetical protein
MAEQDFLPKPSVVPVCGIGASAGGLEALHKFFGALPDDLGLAYVVTDTQTGGRTRFIEKNSFHEIGPYICHRKFTQLFSPPSHSVRKRNQYQHYSYCK